MSPEMVTILAHANETGWFGAHNARAIYRVSTLQEMVREGLLHDTRGCWNPEYRITYAGRKTLSRTQ